MQPLADLDSGQMWTVLGLAAMALIYATVIRPMMRRRRDPLERTPGFANISRQRDVEKQMQSLLVELSEMVRQINAQIDTRTAKLELLIKDADQKIAMLRSESMGQSMPSAPVSSPIATAAESMPDPRHAEIYNLADAGRDPNQIATELNRPRGEVELILALRGK